MIFNRSWAMPNSDTHKVKPIGEFIQRYLKDAKVSVDPFARTCNWATITNDLDPNTPAQYHLDAEVFLKQLLAEGVKADVVICDPPWTARQASEMYKSIGLVVTQQTTQLSRTQKDVKDAIAPIVADGGIVLHFGFHTNGMGKSRGYEIIEMLDVAHGGAHFDSLCIAERKL